MEAINCYGLAACNWARGTNCGRTIIWREERILGQGFGGIGMEFSKKKGSRRNYYSGEEKEFCQGFLFGLERNSLGNRISFERNKKASGAALDRGLWWKGELIVEKERKRRSRAAGNQSISIGD
ncbi:unnamed protein product [Linum trigynum]|uniref:Uncharacterized protein n=1 Tax=Linum trigynum TaxID=586398 RepID=A0AAV2FL47_9ROSI